jgi:hypothetical protein
MPSVKWIKKDQILAQKIAVPYRVLKHEYHYEEGVETSNEAANGHKIIHGDQLETLKSLLPLYEGKISRIYAAPPDCICSNEWIGRNKHLYALMNRLLSDDGIILFAEEDGLVTTDLQESIGTILQNDACRNMILLDLYSRSVITAYFILHLNKKDGGTRQFISVSKQPDLADITATAIKRIITGYKNKEAKGGYFDRYSIGEALFTGNDLQLLNATIPVKQIREYIWFSETGCGFSNNLFYVNEPYLLGKYQGTAYYFMYENERNTDLDNAFLAAIETKADKYIIYANSTTLSEKELKINQILFKQIPADIIRI